MFITHDAMELSVDAAELLRAVIPAEEFAFEKHNPLTIERIREEIVEESTPSNSTALQLILIYCLVCHPSVEQRARRPPRAGLSAAPAPSPPAVRPIAMAANAEVMADCTHSHME